MVQKRLTRRAEIDNCPGIWVQEGFANEGLRTWFNGYDEGYSAISKCAEYEDLEEQGLLMRLPCKVGDTVYYISEGFIEPCTVKVIFLGDYKDENGNCSYMAEIHFTREDCPYVSTEIYFTDFGKTVFHDKEQAEEALRKMEGD